MSLSLFRAQLRSAVREAQEQAPDPMPTDAGSPAKPKLEVLRRVARGELSAERALAELEPRR